MWGSRCHSWASVSSFELRLCSSSATENKTFLSSRLVKTDLNSLCKMHHAVYMHKCVVYIVHIWRRGKGNGEREASQAIIRSLAPCRECWGCSVYRLLNRQHVRALEEKKWHSYKNELLFLSISTSYCYTSCSLLALSRDVSAGMLFETIKCNP